MGEAAAEGAEDDGAAAVGVPALEAAEAEGVPEEASVQEVLAGEGAAAVRLQHSGAVQLVAARPTTAALP